jgi:hypothetical protein
VVNKTKAMKRLGLLWLAGALITWSLAQTREVYSGRTRGEGVTFEIHALERMPLYLMGWPVWLYWRVMDQLAKGETRTQSLAHNEKGQERGYAHGPSKLWQCMETLTPQLHEC